MTFWGASLRLPDILLDFFMSHFHTLIWWHIQTLKLILAGLTLI